jgi:class 3 adenylate cyclase
MSTSTTSTGGGAHKKWPTTSRSCFLTTAQGAEADFDRILATVLFTDIVASTEAAGRMGDRARRDLIASHHKRVRSLLARFRGREVDVAGDGFLAVFDGPARAVRCGLAICEDAGALGFDVRVGVHTGEVELDGPAVRGIAVHIGARVAAEATPADVLVTSTVKDLGAGSGLRFADRGQRELKGVPGACSCIRPQHPRAPPLSKGRGQVLPSNADAGSAGVGRYGLDRNQPSGVVMARR